MNWVPLAYSANDSQLQPAGSGITLDTLTTLLDSIDYALIVCDAAHAVRFANRAAQAELGRGTLLARDGPRLRCPGTGGAALDAAIRAATTRSCRHLICLRAGEDRLPACVVPLSLATASAAAAPAALLMLGRRALCTPLALQMLGRAHGLTSAEQQVLAELINHATPREIALSRGITLATVRSHISSLRGKFGVHTVEELVMQVAGTPPMPPALALAA